LLTDFDKFCGAQDCLFPLALFMLKWVKVWKDSMRKRRIMNKMNKHIETISIAVVAMQISLAGHAQPGFPSVPQPAPKTTIPPMILEEGVSEGVILKEKGVCDGYVLISAAGMKATYLINNDGFVVHHWNHEVATSKSAYILPDGTLLRTVRKDKGDVGDSIQKLSWGPIRRRSGSTMILSLFRTAIYWL
jgi:hypothetical protein